MTEKLLNDEKRKKLRDAEKRKKLRDVVMYEPLSDADLQKIIDSLPVEDSHKKWLPLICMFSGLRKSEFSLLSPADIKEVEGVLCFDLREKPTKNILRRRLVPVHSMLLNMGLADYLKTCSPEVLVSKKDAVWKWFDYSIKLNFHPLRIKLINMLKPEPNVKIFFGVQDGIVGVGELKELVEKIKYDVDFSKFLK